MYKAQNLQASFVKTGLLFNTYQCNLLLQSYINCGAFFEAHKLLNFIPRTNIVSFNTILSGFFKSHLVNEGLKFFDSTAETDCQSWNIVISGCIKSQKLKQAFTHFIKMRHSSIRPDNFTYSIVIPCCDFGFGKQVHAEVIKVCSYKDSLLWTNLIRMYAEVGDMKVARKVFDGMTDRDLITWNVLISCYSKCGMGCESVELFRILGREGGIADEYTYAIVVHEFVDRSQVFEAMQVHSIILRRGFCSDSFICNSLVNLYAKCGFAASAFLLFEEIPCQEVVSWTVIISGFCQSGYVKEAFLLFHKMRLFLIVPNSYTVGSLVSACASSSAFRGGQQIHGLVLKTGLETNIVVGNAVVDMYSKCGVMDDALRVFRSMPEKDIVSWNAIICGFTQNDEGMNALKLFDEMELSKSSHTMPKDVTFVGILSACCHNGLVKEGCNYFNDMIKTYTIVPKKEHYTCMVDLLARAGLLKEAKALMLGSHIKPDEVTLTALLAACKLHGNLQMARSIGDRLYGDENCDDSSKFVLLSNSYVGNDRWNEAMEVREMMDAKGIKKTYGCSWIEIESCMYPFLAGDRLNPQLETISDILRSLYMQMEHRYLQWFF